ncbi:hypothetical protein [Klenkia terrae]|uniref:Uncharacterized protein n=1 Tax=Klenkia terrae TaxID=1052259 RepID=A0ABU8EA58_9ACTN|nr:hypothetical protein [Klenkia terrae]
MQQSYADRVLAARLGVAGLVDPAMEALERALASKDEAVALRAAGAAQVVLERLARKGATVAFHMGEDGATVRSGADIVRERLRAVGAARAEHPGGGRPGLGRGDRGQAVEAELVDEWG